MRAKWRASLAAGRGRRGESRLLRQLYSRSQLRTESPDSPISSVFVLS